MKITFLAAIILMLFSCKSQKATVDNLPKDIALKPEREMKHSLIETDKDPQKIAEEIKILRTEINTLLSAQTCTESDEIKIVPMGSKACGGPESYVGYTAASEKLIAPKIEKYTSLVSEYNKLTDAMSDCALVMPPTAAKCADGKIILEHSQEK